MMKFEQREPIPAGANPFHYDAVRMGTYVASNVCIMHMTHNTQKATHIVIVNTETGERVMVTL